MIAEASGIAPSRVRLRLTATSRCPEIPLLVKNTGDADIVRQVAIDSHLGATFIQGGRLLAREGHARRAVFRPFGGSGNATARVAPPATV
jgi:hypothetical protein